MDGYAFSFTDWKENGTLTIEEVIEAGRKSEVVLRKGTAARIFTGAPVPRGADTVVMQEKVLVEHNRLSIEDDKISEGTNICERIQIFVSEQTNFCDNENIHPGKIKTCLKFFLLTVRSSTKLFNWQRKKALK